MPTKKNYQGNQQNYNPHDGEYESGPQSAFSSFGNPNEPSKGHDVAALGSSNKPTDDYDRVFNKMYRGKQFDDPEKVKKADRDLFERTNYLGHNDLKGLENAIDERNNKNDAFASAQDEYNKGLKRYIKNSGLNELDARKEFQENFGTIDEFKENIYNSFKENGGTEWSGEDDAMVQDSIAEFAGYDDDFDNDGLEEVEGEQVDAGGTLTNKLAGMSHLEKDETKKKVYADYFDNSFNKKEGSLEDKLAKDKQNIANGLKTADETQKAIYNKQLEAIGNIEKWAGINSNEKPKVSEQEIRDTLDNIIFTYYDNDLKTKDKWADHVFKNMSQYHNITDPNEQKALKDQINKIVGGINTNRDIADVGAMPKENNDVKGDLGVMVRELFNLSSNARTGDTNDKEKQRHEELKQQVNKLTGKKLFTGDKWHDRGIQEAFDEIQQSPVNMLNLDESHKDYDTYKDNFLATIQANKQDSKYEMNKAKKHGEDAVVKLNKGYLEVYDLIEELFNAKTK